MGQSTGHWRTTPVFKPLAPAVPTLGIENMNNAVFIQFHPRTHLDPGIDLLHVSFHGSSHFPQPGRTIVASRQDAVPGRIEPRGPDGRLMNKGWTERFSRSRIPKPGRRVHARRQDDVTVGTV